ncbi:MAG: hypothetical protein HY762_05200 [Planctomycetes bacterium]|nr:hypothetical protein [Planctomycetota bacterium]
MNWLTEHKNELMVIGGCGALFLAVYYLVLAPFHQEANELKEQQAKTIKTIETDFRSGNIRDRKDIANITDELKYVDGKLSQLKERVTFRLRPDYQLPAEKRDWLITLQSRLKSLQKRTENTAAARGIKLPALEFQFNEAQDLSLYFEELDVIDQLLSAAIESGCSEVLAVGTASEIGPGGKGFHKHNTADAAAGKNLVPIKIKGTFESLMRLVHMIQSPEQASGRFLALESVVLESDQPDVDTMTGTIIVSGVK